MASKTAENSTTADLAETCKLLALALCQQFGAAPKSIVPKPKRRAQAVAASGARLRINEITGNGQIPKDSSNYGKQALR